MNKSIGLPFKSELVPKVLDGSKTQTRRLPGIHNCRLLAIGTTPDEDEYVTGRMKGLDWDSVKAVRFAGHKDSQLKVSRKIFLIYHPEDEEYYELVPRHEPGDIAWMREAFCVAANKRCHPEGICYRADKRQCALAAGPDWPSWKPSIHLHRKDSRWERPLKSVRIELLQDISADDCVAEGIPSIGPILANTAMLITGTNNLEDCEKKMKIDLFAELWDSINASRGWSWEANKPVVCFDWK